MRLTFLRDRFLARSIPFVLAVSVTTTSFGDESRALRMPQSFAIASSSDDIKYHTDLGVMGELETIRERYQDGTVKIERQVTLDRDGNYVNHGAWKMFSARGDVVAEGHYHFGKRVGLWTRWHERNDAPIFAEFPYSQFKPPFMSQAMFTDGQLDGEWIISDVNENKMFQVSLKNGRRHGMGLAWFPNGKIFRQANYEHGTPVGDLIEADKKTGELQRAATYIEGRKLISRTTYHQNGRQKKSETSYLGAITTEETPDDFWNVRLAKYVANGNDLRHGVAKVWYPNGKLEQEGFYQFDKKSGLFTYWHENGQTATTGEYRDDKPIGNWVWWHENGQKSVTGRYENGELTGEWRWWNEAGKLTKQHIYDGTKSVSAENDSRIDVSERIDNDEDDLSIF